MGNVNEFIGRLTGRTKVLGIIGHPVAHSLSPLMQNAALEAVGIDCIYVPFPVRPAELPSAIMGIRTLGIAGFNVTIPHKTAILGLVDDISREAELIGAVNTVIRDGDRLIGHNTDSSGFMKSLQEDLAFDPENARVLLLGAGGAARAALVALVQAGISAVTVANRTSETAEELLAVLDRCGASVSGSHAALSIFNSRDAMGSFDLIVNTTSVGMNSTSFEGFEASFLKADACIYDMVYVPAETPLLKVGREHSLKVANGAGMLAAQGEEAFRLWTGCDPPPGIMKETILAALTPAA